MAVVHMQIMRLSALSCRTTPEQLALSADRFVGDVTPIAIKSAMKKLKKKQDI